MADPVNINVTVARPAVEVQTTIQTNTAAVSATNQQKVETFRSGPQGQSAYEVWLGEGNIGTKADFILSLQGQPGTGVLPVGGTTNQALVKLSNADQDVGWADQSVESLDGGNF